MAINRPSKPSATLPQDFGGVQTPYTSAQISSGYQDGIPQVVDGGNMNYERKGLFQGMKYLRTIVDFIRDTPIGKIFWINSNGQMDYMTPAVIATNSEYTTGTATDKTPNVKQVVDNLALKADDSNTVHKTGNETIAGTKSFSGNIRTTSYVSMQKNGITKGTAPSSSQYTQIVLYDGSNSYTDQTAMGRIQNVIQADNQVFTQVMAYANIANSIKSGYIRVLYDTNNSRYYGCISGTDNAENYSRTKVSNSTTDDMIPTMGWVNNPATSTNVVHRSGDETIGGDKTFTNRIISKVKKYVINIQQTDLAKGSNPSSFISKHIGYYDNSGDTGTSHALGLLQYALTDSGETRVDLLAFKNEAGSSVSGRISISYPATGNPYTYAPTPDTSDNSTKIATTAYVTSKIISSRIPDYSQKTKINAYSYTMPSDGFCFINVGGGYRYIWLNDVFFVESFGAYSGGAISRPLATIPVKSGDKIDICSSDTTLTLATSGLDVFWFVPYA